MATAEPATAKGGFRAWLNKRLPVDEFMESQLLGYFAPKNFNVWYFFGSLALLVFVIQIVTGIFLTMNYKPGELIHFPLRLSGYYWPLPCSSNQGSSYRM